MSTLFDTLPNFRCRVIGTPQPQGSSRAFVPKGWKRAVITSANPKNKGWRDSMSGAFAEAIETRNLETPVFSDAVHLDAEFVMPRTKSLPKRGRPHTVKPDLDKLLRSLGDSLSESQILRDDSLITAWTTRKRYAEEGEQPGVIVEVRTA